MLRGTFLMVSLIQCVLSNPLQADPLADTLAKSLLSRTGGPGVAIAYYRDGHDGLAVSGVRATGSDVAVAPEDLWHISSNTKSMTATLVARLVEAGSISWDDTIGMVLGSAIPEMNAGYRDVTYRQLLAHRAGLMPNLGILKTLRLAGSADKRDLKADRISYAAALLRRPPLYAPGSEFLYSNAGFVIAGAMLEATTGTAWEALIEREVFAPLGLASAGFGPPGTVGSLDQPRGHRKPLFGKPRAQEPTIHADNIPAVGPAGTVHMNAGDLLKYLVVHLAEETDYLSKASWQALHEPASGEQYVAGWGVAENEALIHSGSNTFWYVLVAIWPEKKAALVLAANYGDINRLDPAFNEIARQFIESE